MSPFLSRHSPRNFPPCSKWRERSLYSNWVFTPQNPERALASCFGGVPWINDRHQWREPAGSQIPGHADVMGKANFLEMLMLTLSTQGTQCWRAYYGGCDGRPVWPTQFICSSWKLLKLMQTQELFQLLLAIMVQWLYVGHSISWKLVKIVAYRVKIQSVIFLMLLLGNESLTSLVFINIRHKLKGWQKLG